MAVMGAYLLDHPGTLRQYSARTNWRPSRPTGLTVIHTAESVMDTIGPDTAAEDVAAFIRRRSDPGSYHDLCDSDSVVWLVPYEFGAWQDGTGSNGMAMSISFACRAIDWARMAPERRDGFLRQGAVAFRRQQAWLRANGYPATPLRRISKAQSDAGVAGFISHAERDPARRSDPGRDFPWTRFFQFCAGEDDDMPLTNADAETIWAFRYPSPVSRTPGHKVGMAEQVSAGLLHAAKGREAAEQALAIATKQAKEGRALTQEEIDRIADATSARVAKEVADSIQEGYDAEVTLRPKPGA